LVEDVAEVFAADYYGADLGRAAAGHICALHPVTDQVVSALNPVVTLVELGDDIASIGYPK
jgi:hypothetical protein